MGAAIGGCALVVFILLIVFIIRRRRAPSTATAKPATDMSELVPARSEINPNKIALLRQIGKGIIGTDYLATYTVCILGS